MKYAEYDETVASPSPVIGWYDTDEFEYPSLPPTTRLVEMTDDEWANRMSKKFAITDGKLVEYDPKPVALPWMVSKLKAVERLGQIGKLRAMREALKMDAADSTLSDAELLLRDRWNASQMLSSDDAQIRGFLTQLSIDPDTILAKDTI